MQLNLRRCERRPSGRSVFTVLRYLHSMRGRGRPLRPPQRTRAAWQRRRGGVLRAATATTATVSPNVTKPQSQSRRAHFLLPSGIQRRRRRRGRLASQWQRRGEWRRGEMSAIPLRISGSLWISDEHTFPTGLNVSVWDGGLLCVFRGISWNLLAWTYICLDFLCFFTWSLDG